MGNVILAILLCLTKSLVIALVYETKTNGITVTDKKIWEINIK